MIKGLPQVVFHLFFLNTLFFIFFVQGEAPWTREDCGTYRGSRCERCKACQQEEFDVDGRLMVPGTWRRLVPFRMPWGGDGGSAKVRGWVEDVRTCVYLCLCVCERETHIPACINSYIHTYVYSHITHQWGLRRRATREWNAVGNGGGRR